MESTFFHRRRIHSLYRIPDRVIHRGEIQGCSQIIVVSRVIKESLPHFQHNRGTGAVKVRHDLLAVVNFFEVPTWLHIAPASIHPAVIFLILLPEYLQQILSICAAVLGGIQQCHGLLRQHPALVQKRPKLLIVENMGRQEADIRIVGQVDQAGQRDGADVPSALDLEQAVQAHTVVLTQHGQPLGQEVQFIQVDVVADHPTLDAGIFNFGQLIMTVSGILDPGFLQGVVKLCPGSRHLQRSGCLVPL